MFGEESLIGLLNCACCATLHGPPKRMWASWSDVQIHTCAPWLELSCRSIIQDISRLHSHPIEDEQPPTYESQSFAQQKLLSIVSICVFLDNIFPPAIAFYPFAISMKSSLSLSLFQVTIVSSLTFNPQMDDEVSKVRILDRSPLATNILHSLIVIISFGFCLQIFGWFPRWR